MSLPLLAGDRLRRTFGADTVVDVDRIEVFEGETLALLGPGGSGKSTLLRLLAMLEPPTSGRVTFRGHAGQRGERALRSSSAIVLERPHLWRESAAYNIGLGLRLRRVSPLETDRRVARVCAALQIEHVSAAPVMALSPAEAWRVALAQALVLEPDLLFLDEPASALDTDAAERARRGLAGLARDRSLTLVLATRHRNLAFHLADRVTVLADGKLRQTGSPADLYASPGDPWIAAPTGAELVFAARVTAVHGATLEVEAGGLALSVVGEAAVGAAVHVVYRPEDLLLSPATLAVAEGSARNLFYANVAGRADDRGLVRMRLRGPLEFVALLTRTAADRLALEPDTRVAVRVAATALRAYPVEDGPRARPAPGPRPAVVADERPGEVAAHQARDPAHGLPAAARAGPGSPSVRNAEPSARDVEPSEPPAGTRADEGAAPGTRPAVPADVTGRSGS